MISSDKLRVFHQKHNRIHPSQFRENPADKLGKTPPIFCGERGISMDNSIYELSILIPLVVCHLRLTPRYSEFVINDGNLCYLIPTYYPTYAILSQDL